MFATSSEKKMITVCSKCGSSFKEEVQFCDKCGSNIEKEKIIKEQTHNNQQLSTSQLNNKLQGQLQIIAVIEIAFGGFGMFLGLLMAIMAPFMPEIANTNPTETYSAQMLDFFTVLVGTLAGIILIVSASAVFVGYKLYRLENVGRFGTLIFASLSLIMIPFGTVYGVICFYLLSKPETIELLRNRNQYL